MSIAERPAAPVTDSGAEDALFVVSGVVVPGDQRGRLLGFPTANLPLGESSLSDGVYAGTVYDETDGSTRIAAVSVGRRTSFYGRDGERLLEAHLLDFDGSLYGHAIVVELRAKLRPQRRYRGAEALVEQLARDIEATRTWAREQSANPARNHGRWGPVTAKTRRTDAGEPERIRRDREQRRLAAIAQTVGSVERTEVVTYELVAERSRIPVAYLRWAYPSIEELLAVAESIAPAADAAGPRS
ncbi:hypothetical protein HQQ80_12200 [Microbacteriaceae bacterium VKM Ac-2855]|nr:hypothetical protein [Microbacteriaceae bacterium VKM Ac-2855]